MASAPYTITAEDWAERGVTGDTVTWSADNAWSAPGAARLHAA
ncbi:hypothetical protein AB4Z39_25530 [Mycobacterium adipatum]